MALRAWVNTTDRKMNIADFLKKNNISLQKISDDEKQYIAENYSTEELLKYTKEDAGNGLVTKANLLDIIRIRTNLDNKEKLDIIEDKSKQLADIEAQKQRDEKTKDDDIKALKALLDYDDKKNENNKDEMDYLIEDIALNKKNREILEKIKTTRQQLDVNPKPEGEKKAELEKQRKNEKEELKKIIMDKNFAYFKNFSEQYNWNLEQLETKRVSVTRKPEQQNWERVITLWPQLRFRQNRLSRLRINRTIQELNAIWNKPKEWVRYVLSRTFGWKWVIRGLKSRLLIKDVSRFDKMYNAQKKRILEDLEVKMDKKSMSARDREVISAVRKRLDYYQVAYKRQIITV